MMGHEVQKQISLSWDKEADKRALQAAARYDKKLAAGKQRESERTAITAYIKANVKDGDFLRFTGTRNDGYRSFVKLRENEQAVVSFVASRGSKGRIMLENYSSTNHIDHLIAHYPNQYPNSMVLDDNTVVVSRAKMLEIDAVI